MQGAAVLLALALAGCGAVQGDARDEGAARTSEEQELIGGDVIAPVTKDATALRGASVDLVVGQTLNIDTASLDVASYRGAVSDPEVAVFTAGHRDDSAEFNPGVTALAVGTTEVTLTHEQGGVEPLRFTVVVSAQ